MAGSYQFGLCACSRQTSLDCVGLAQGLEVWGGTSLLPGEEKYSK